MSNQLQAPIIDTTVKKYEWNGALLQGTYQVYYNILNDDESLNPILFYSITDINTNITTYWYGQTTSITFNSQSNFLIKMAYMDIEDLESGDRPSDYDLHQKDESFLVSYKDKISPWSNKLVISPMTSTPSCSIFIENEALSNTVNYKPYELMGVKIIFTDPVLPFDLKVFDSENSILESAFDLGDYGQKQFVYSFKTRFFDVSLSHSFIKLAISYQTLDGYSREQNFIINLKQYSEFADSDKNWELEIKSSYGINAISLNPLQDGTSSDILEKTDSEIGDKLVPMNAASAKVTKIGGMTRKCTNLIVYPYLETTKTANGITFTDNGDGTITVNGTATADATFNLNNISYEANTHYKVSGCPSGGSTETYFLHPRGFASDIGAGVSIYHESNFDNDIRIEIKAGTTVSSLLFKPMMNLGETFLPYESYFAGFRNAPVTNIKSISANIWNEKEVATLLNATEDGDYYKFKEQSTTVIDNYPFKENTSYTLTFTGYSNSRGRITTYYTDETSISAVFMSETETTLTYTTDSSKTVSHVLVSWGTYGYTWFKKGGVMFNEGATALPYEPYTETVLAIPATVQSQHGYGWGVNENYYNYIDWDIKRFVRNVDCVNLGTLDWSIASNNRFFATPFSLYSASDTNEMPIAIISADYVSTTGQQFDAYEKAFYISTDGRLAIKDTSYTDAASFKTAMNGVMFYYKLAEPVIIDISTILPDDNQLDIVPGGHIIFENEYSYSVPNTVEYQLYLNQILIERNNKPLICSPSITSAYLDFLGDPFSNYKATLINDSTSKYLTINQFTQLNPLEHMALVDKDSYLQIKFNPEITNIKKNLNESVVATLGGNYPYVRRNGNIKYRQFQIGGLISYWALDEGENLNLGGLLQLINISRNSYSSYPANDREVLLEREFRDKVLDFLYKDNVKLFMSNEEGKILVKLTNITLTPMKQLGRRIYSFSAQAIEVDDVENLAKYDIPHGLPVSFS